VALVRTEISGERIASIIRVTRIKGEASAHAPLLKVLKAIKVRSDVTVMKGIAYVT
jgi:hypothetical protein